MWLLVEWPWWHRVDGSVEELDRDDPFVAAVAPGRRVWAAVDATHWTLQSIGSLPRESAGRQLVLTSRELLTLGPLAVLRDEPAADGADVEEAPYAALGLPDPRDGSGPRVGIRRYPYARVDHIRFRKLGAEGFLGFTYRRSDGGQHDVEYAMPKPVAKGLVEQLQLLHQQARDDVPRR